MRPLPTEILYSILFHTNSWPVLGSSTSIQTLCFLAQHNYLTKNAVKIFKTLLREMKDLSYLRTNSK